MDASQLIDQKIASLRDWRGPRLQAIRDLIRKVDPEIFEEWKWMGSPVWNRYGILCVANAHKSVIKVTFPKGAQLPDPHGVFNAGLGGNAWRAIDSAEQDALDVEGLKGLVRAAIALNRDKPAARKPGASSVTAKTRAAKPAPAAKKPVATQSAAQKTAAKTRATRKAVDVKKRVAKKKTTAAKKK